MTALTMRRDTSQALTPDRWSRVRGGIVALAAITVAVVVLIEARTSAGERIHNTTATAAARSYQSFLGTDHWPQIFEIVSLLLAMGFWSVSITKTIRARAMTPTLLLLIVTTLMTVFDPIMNWAPYAAYDPRLLHFPETWGWVSLAPTVEPLVVVVGYSYFFLIPAYATLAVHRRIQRHVPEQSVIRRRPLATTLAVSLVLCIVWDGAIEGLLTRMGVYSYTQVVGSLSIRAGSRSQFPLYEALLFGIVISLTGPLMRRDVNNLTWSEQVAARTSLGQRHRSLFAVVLTFAVMSGIYLAYGAVFAVIRDTNAAATVARPWPFPTAKVYDPNGDYRHSGEPGPYMKGNLSAGAKQH